jgi:heme exporter protein D
VPDLGKYAVEVLAAYGVTLGLLTVLVVISWRRSARVRAALERIENNG